MPFQLTDDGTMDTVIRCDECGAEIRYNYSFGGPDQAQDDEPQESYEDFIAWAIEDAESWHDCNSDGD